MSHSVSWRERTPGSPCNPMSCCKFSIGKICPLSLYDCIFTRLFAYLVGFCLYSYSLTSMLEYSQFQKLKSFFLCSICLFPNRGAPNRGLRVGSPVSGIKTFEPALAHPVAKDRQRVAVNMTTMWWLEKLHGLNDVECLYVFSLWLGWLVVLIFINPDYHF